MSPLLYLLLRQFKNILLDLKNKPAKLFLIIISAALILFSTISNSINHGNSSLAVASNDEFMALVLAFYMFSFLMPAYNGFSKGATLFNMADIHLLFTAPLKPINVLVYGMIKQSALSLWLALILILQYNWIGPRYNIDLPYFLLIVLGYALAYFSGTLAAMAIYSMRINPKKRKTIYILFYAFMAVFLILLARPILIDLVFNINTLIAAANQPILNFMPIFGWIKFAITCLASGQLLWGFAGIAAVIICNFILLKAISSTGSGFYEDVLSATEQGQKLKQAKAEGKDISELNLGNTTKKHKSGLNHGLGANAFFFKQLQESSRLKFLFFDLNTIIFMIMTIVYSYFMGLDSLISVLAFTAYLQIFTSMNNNFSKELKSHYIYLAPAKPFDKLLSILGQPIIKIIVEALIAFGIIGIIWQITIYQILILVLFRVSFGLIFLSGSVLSLRINVGKSRSLVIFINIILGIALCLPGLALAFAATVLMLGDIYLNIAILSIWNIFAALLTIFLCRNLLQYPRDI